MSSFRACLLTLGLFPSPQIVTFVANFHKLVEMGFSPERIKQALLLHEDGDVQKAIMYVVALLDTNGVRLNFCVSPLASEQLSGRAGQADHGRAQGIRNL